MRAGLTSAGAAVVLLAMGCAASAADPATPGDAARNEAEIARLRAELAGLAGRERGVLDEIARLDAELALADRELQRARDEHDRLSSTIQARDQDLQALELAQAERRRWLAFRLRETYKAGAGRGLGALSAAGEAERGWQVLSYAAVLAARDARTLRTWRSAAARSTVEREELRRSREGLVRLEQELGQARARVEASRTRRTSALAQIRQDESRQRAALAEFEQAAQGLQDVVGRSSGAAGARGVDARALAGRLEWPAHGRVAVGFGSRTHARFKTDVPHPGWDIEAVEGSDIRAVHAGTVAFADWMRGYGLTVIVDHGGGLLSVYAHAAALAVGRGQSVNSGQLLGQVGDTGSLRGPFLYFELRLDGKPVDPAAWLRPR
jgi:septal ring factor EnvC (AmiA/AmiB activator)